MPENSEPNDKDQSREIQKKENGDSDGPEEILNMMQSGKGNRITREVGQFMAIIQKASGMGSFQEKLTNEHITDIIKQSGEDDVRQHLFSIGGRRYAMTVFIILLLFLTFMLIYFQDKPEILSHLVAFLGGGGAGYAISGQLQKK